MTPAQYAAAIEKWMPFIWQQSRKHCLDSEELDDYVQDVVLLALNLRDKYDPARARFSTFIGKCCYWVRQKRGRKIQPKCRQVVTHALTEGVAVRLGYNDPDPALDHHDAVAAAQWLLTPRETAVAQMRAQGLTLQQIGDRLGLTKERIRQIELRVSQKALAVIQ